MALLITLMFASGASFTDKIMSTMKRGALMCVVFFILALVSSAGPNAAKISKALGALIIVAILVTSPVNTAIKDLDNLVKNDWVGTPATSDKGATGNAPTADTGTSNVSSNPADAFINSIEQQLKLQGQKAATGPGDVVKTGVENGIVSTLNGIIPGSGTIIGKIFGF